MSILNCNYDVQNINLPDNISLTDYVFEGPNDDIQKVAVIDDKTGDTLTYGQLERKINCLAQALCKRGIRRGDVVCLYADRSLFGIIAVFAIFKAGATLTPCRPFHGARELATQLKDSGSTILIADQNLMSNALKAAEETSSIKTVYSIGAVADHECLEDMIDGIDSFSAVVPDSKFNSKEDVAVVIYSSGTTGLPKGVMLTHYNIVSALCMYSEPHLKILTDDVYFHFAPPFHVAGLATMSMYFRAKKTLLLYTPVGLRPFLLKAKEYKIRFLPTMPQYMTELCKLSVEELKQLDMDFSNVIINTGGSVIKPGITNEVVNKVGVKAVVQGYGCTETCAAVTIDSVENFVPGSAGVVMSHTNVKIIDINTGSILGVNQTGEVCVKGPQIMKGYLNNPDATKQALDGDGFFHTGDLGYYDDSEHLFIVDRLKDVIKFQTMQVSPAEIEEVIYTHPGVKSVCVVGVDDSAGEVPMACVVVKDGHEVTKEEIVNLVKENLADYKQLRGGVKFMKEFPLNSMGKIKRKELRDSLKGNTA